MGSTPGGRQGGGEEEAEPSLRTPLLHKSGSAALAALARLRHMPAECQAPGTLRGVSWPRRTTARYFAALALAEEETPPRSHGSGVIEPRFESGSVGCPRAPLPRSGRSLILTGTRDSIRLRTRVTIRPCSELRAPRPRHGPLRGVTSPRGILSWCSPGRRQHQGPASRLDHTPPASGGVSVAGDGFGPRRHLLAAGPREACPLSTRSALGQPGVTSSLVSHTVNGPWASDAPSPRHVRRAPRASPAPPP